MVNGRSSSESIWALKDVSFQVKRGEIVGRAPFGRGRKGAGKCTLLKILSRITAPTSGHVKVKGRIASLLEVRAPSGRGFNPELTGRENACPSLRLKTDFLNGAIPSTGSGHRLGMKRAETCPELHRRVEVKSPAGGRGAGDGYQM